jgi:hypothetical protein
MGLLSKSAYAATAMEHTYRKHNLQSLPARLCGLHNFDCRLDLDITSHRRAKHIVACRHSFEVELTIRIGFDNCELSSAF